MYIAISIYSYANTYTPMPKPLRLVGSILIIDLCGPAG